MGTEGNRESPLQLRVCPGEGTFLLDSYQIPTRALHPTDLKLSLLFLERQLRNVRLHRHEEANMISFSWSFDSHLSRGCHLRSLRILALVLLKLVSSIAKALESNYGRKDKTGEKGRS